MGNVLEMLGAGSKNLGFSDQTLEEEDIAFVQLCGLYHWSRAYTIFYLNIFIWGIPSILAMIIYAGIEGDSAVVFETSHFFLIIANMFVQSSVHLFHHKTVNQLYRAIDSGFFSYDQCIFDHETLGQIEKLRMEKKKRKKMYGVAFKFLASGAAVGLLLKPAVVVLLLGKGDREVDGYGGFMYNSPIRNWVPYAGYWVPYVFGMIHSQVMVIGGAITAMASVSSFVRFSEEFCHQLDIVSLGLENVIRRAKFLYELRHGLAYSENDSWEPRMKFQKCLRDCLNTTIDHHVLIIDLFAGFKKMMLIPLFTVVFDGGALLFLSTGLCLSDESTLLKIVVAVFLATELMYTFIYCGYGELLTQKRIGKSMYFDDWLDHKKILTPYFTIIRAYTFRPKKLSAGFASPSNATFGDVLRTAYSFLNLLLNRGRGKS